MFGRWVIAVAFGLVLVVGSVGASLAADPHSGGGTGQPSQTCLSATAPQTPGNASTSPGSPFNEPGSGGNPNNPGGVAGTHYAGQQPQNSQNPNSVAQYDVACFQVSNNQP